MRNKELQKLLKWAKSLGWEIDAGGKHVKLIPPKSHMELVYCSKTPSCHRSLRNARALVKKSMRAPRVSRYKQ